VNYQILKLSDNSYAIGKTVNPDDEIPIRYENFEIGPNGIYNIEITKSKIYKANEKYIDKNISSLYFSIKTSHGNHEIMCNKIRHREDRVKQFVSHFPSHLFLYKYRAMLYYYWLTFKSLFSKVRE